MRSWRTVAARCAASAPRKPSCRHTANRRMKSLQNVWGSAVVMCTCKCLYKCTFTSAHLQVPPLTLFTVGLASLHSQRFVNSVIFRCEMAITTVQRKVLELTRHC